MGNIIVALIIFFIVSLSLSKVIRDKRKGRKCGGCPDAGSCSSKVIENKNKRNGLQEINIKEVV